MRLLFGSAVLLSIVLQIYSAYSENPFFRDKYDSVTRSAIPAKRVAISQRGSKHFDPQEDGFFDNFGFKKGQYVGEREKTDIRSNVAGEPGIDYAAYLDIPRTTFSCIGRKQGYYADEETGCQAFHVCDDDQISSFLCPVGSLFSQRLLTCDWWSKVVCSQSRQFYNRKNNRKTIPSRKDYLQSENVEETLNYFQHDRPQHTLQTSEVKEDSRRMSNNELNIRYEDSPIVRITIQPKSIKKLKNDEYSSFNGIRQDQPSRQSIQHSSSAYSTSAAEEQSNTNKNNYDIEGEKKNPISLVADTKEDTTQESETAGDMEGKESIGLINAHSERNLETTGNQFVEEIGSTTELIIMSRETGQLSETTVDINANNAINGKPMMKNLVPKLNEYEEKTKLLNITGMSDEVNIIQTSESPRVTTIECQENVTFRAADQEQRPNGHKQVITLFDLVGQKKPNTSIIRANLFDNQQKAHQAESEQKNGSRQNNEIQRGNEIRRNQENSDANDRYSHEQSLDFMKYGVNYQTHYYPEVFSTYQNNQRSLEHASNQEANYDPNEKANYVPNNESKTNIQSRRSEQAMDYYYDYQHYDSVGDDSDTNFENFGTRIFNDNE